VLVSINHSIQPGIDQGRPSTYRLNIPLGLGRLTLPLPARTSDAAEFVAESSEDAGLAGIGTGWLFLGLCSCGDGRLGLGLVSIPTSPSDALKGAADSIHGFGVQDGTEGGDRCRVISQ
jgi:hypothetical protein